MSQEQPLEINISSSALGHAGCELNLHRTIVDGYKEKAMSSRMVYGVGFHKFIEIMYKSHGHIPTARDECIKSFASIPRVDDRKSMHLSDINHMTTVSLFGWQLGVLKDTEFEVLDLDGKPAVELTYSFPYYQDEFVKINWCGTIDRLGKIKGGIHLIRDWKTTSSWNKKEYFSRYEMARQPRGYVLAMKLMAERFPDSILGKIGAGPIGVQYDGVFLKPAANDVTIEQSEVYIYSVEQINEFRMLLDGECKKISDSVRTGYLPKQGIINGSCESKWGRCVFWQVCQKPDVVAEMLLKRDFNKVKFNPLAYNDL